MTDYPLSLATELSTNPNGLTQIAAGTLLDGTVTIVDLLGLAVIAEGVLIGALLVVIVYLVRKVFLIVGALAPQIAVQRQLLEQIEATLDRQRQ